MIELSLGECRLDEREHLVLFEADVRRQRRSAM
jgi:hypothetical protein